MKKKKLWITTGLLVLIITMVTLSIINNNRAEEVTVTKLSQPSIGEQLTLSGTISSSKQQVVYPQPEQGELKKVWVTLGQQVQPGTKLLEYDNQTIQGERSQANLAVKQARVKLNSLRKQKSRGGQQGSVMDGQVVGSIDEQMKLAKIELEQAQQQVEQVKRKQNQLIVKSKQEGVVVQVNENARSGIDTEPIVTIQDLEEIKIEANVSEYDVLKVKEGQKVHLTSDALPEKKWTGKVVQVGMIPVDNGGQQTPSGKSTEVNYPVEVKADQKLPFKLGSRVVLEIITSEKKAQALPQSAIKQEGNQSFVFIVRNGKAHKTPVKLGVQNEQWVEIVSGVKQGEPVINHPSSSIVDGAEVLVK